ncbi:MAG: lipopolysaccharide biosynthesis protein [Candidatus Aminicenantes bacterium]|nr:lipopolysaccharide biosynthesis protein [Candidatus Aminicenantes bacterium]
MKLFIEKEPIEKNDFNQPESLSKKVVRGGIWVFALRIINRGLGFIRTIILARLLAPHDFGLLGIALLSISILETFSQTGFQTALIQKKRKVESYLDTAWTVSAIRGIILFLILFSFAPVIAKFFDSAQATLVIRVIAVSTLLSGFRNIGILFFKKELQFNKQFIYEFSGTLVDITVAISLAFILRNVWALVWGGLAANFVRLFMSYIIHPYRPRIKFEKEKFLKLFSFGKWVLGSSILVFLITQGDDIFLGKMLGVSALGLYQMAYLISNLPATEISHVISQVTFPAFSKLQDDLPKLREAYLKVLQLTTFIAIPLAAGILILAPEFTKIFLGDKWMPMVPAIQILVLAGLVRSIAATSGPVFYAKGRAKIDTILQIIRLIVLAALIYPLAIKWGMSGVSIAVFLSIFISNIGFSFMVIKITKCSVAHFTKMMTLPLINGTIAGLLILGLKSTMGTGILEFIIFACMGALVYLILVYLSDKFFNYEMQTLIKESLKSF